MKHEENTSIYVANEGCLIIRKRDGFIMGDCIDLGSADSIENYKDKEYSKEELDAYHATVKDRHLSNKGFINPLKIIVEE